MDPIVLYDIPSNTGSSMSPACWKVRYLLNYKGIAFRTEWTEYPDIAALYERHGIRHTSTNPDGTPKYTIPVLHDPSSGLFISDSFNIAKYLEQTYGSPSPSIFPSGTVALQSAFADMVMSNILLPNFQIMVLIIAKGLNDRSLDFFRQSREKMINKSLEEIAPTPEMAATHWNRLKESLAKFDAYYAHSQQNGPFIMGSYLSWADLSIAGFLTTFRLALGEDSRQWQDVIGWHEGRWGKLMTALEEYQ
ncbi:hypothetical protein D9613_006289 [Agrocybe pediades]|uniref:GST N-terminal domain-containing protein n=1 Tax=Agrocybe pediades TaxID=84607 RepID=A0A8H4QVK9_9AGAR|nr:hypothetical protein D9613_006289 [Agrocybe pediades]KAF9564188.1 hypothetical protein CPC08DRAFT_721210 [Agrocybe pediades]